MGIYHANTVHMSHFGRSGTLLAVSDTLVHTRVHSNPRLRYAEGERVFLNAHYGHTKST